MNRAVTQWLAETNTTLANSSALTKKLNKSYTVYGCMLLLPPTALEGPEWDGIESQLTEHSLHTLYQCIAKHLKITHIAVNKPIPLHHEAELQDESSFNILRSPSNFTPVYGNFGPPTCSLPPTEADFDKAYWVTAKQNGIYQIWAPRWTMFSRGNISEKARLLTLPSVVQVVEDGPCAAVDLYAGIGYFAFSYVKAGLSRVLCWDLNEWSCEGLRRGAVQNKWKVKVYYDGSDDLEEVAKSDARLFVFNESNEHAPEKVDRMRHRLPPIRHVNCGMLPSSRDSLELAAKVLDPEYLGWVHVHENFLVEEIGKKAEETRLEFTELLERQRGTNVRTEVEYINRLKSYAPGVMHCVLDIAVWPA